ncbi:hypothetical protein GCM10011316_30630 [Roseibium aquae]|uniref:PNPLA domain-containing protein n=1 Tax=Roseibium aquae TaxID=1323746 RepID=A0A916TM64_9HYPH|nr:patatin-like phospholipase family protein [Roseibium aquae]GGB56383.1 hypothetical protein GCM10011316_30630 [Roseibium aquae]
MTILDARSQHFERAYVAFSGGGARGLLHLGVLDVIEQQNIKVCGFAGTSAGSIIAALAAAGFTRKRLFNPDLNTTIFDELKQIDPRIDRPSRIFGRFGWWRMCLIRSFPRLFVLLAAAFAAGPVFGAGMVFSAEDISLPLKFLIWIGLFLLLVVYVYLSFFLLVGGIARLERFNRALGLLLSKEVHGTTDKPVKFEDFGNGTGRPELKIVATNLTTRELELFSPQTTPDVCVADAVSASCCIPFVFKAWRIKKRGMERHELYADGGLVSNLPAWCFDEERLLDPDALTFAADIGDDPHKPITSPRRFLVAVIRSAIFGASKLSTRAADHFLHVVHDQATENGHTVKLLDFDISFNTAREAFEDSRAVAQTQIVSDFIEHRNTYRKTAEVIADIVEEYLAILELNRVANGKDEGRVRAAIALPENGMKKSLRLRHGRNYDGISDQGLVLPINGSITGRCWREGKTQVCFRPFDGVDDFPGEGHYRWKSLVWPEMRWLLTVPIWTAQTPHRQEPDFIVVVDGNTYFGENKVLAEEILKELETEIQDTVASLVQG